MKLRTVLIIVLSVVAAAGVGFLIFALVGNVGGEMAAPTTVTTQAPETTVPTETTAPVETTTAPTEPKPEEFVLSFAGDCTFATSGFDAKVGSDYTYPFLDVQPYFSTDDCTFVNLECALSSRGAKANKRFTFRGKPEYVNILKQGSVEFASMANNHSMDFGKVAFDDTKTLLEEAGVPYGVNQQTTMIELERGLKIGVVSWEFPMNTNGIAEAIKSVKDQGAHIVIFCVHWGQEYYYKPNSTQELVGRFAIDNGADIVYGQHSHVLQPVEEYNGGKIFYSLGNFSFGGNANPPDMDTAILQQKVVLNPDGTAELGELTRIPCFVSGTPKKANDYQPMPMDPEKDADAYARVLRKLSGEYEKTKLYVSYRDDLNGGDTPTTPPTTGGESGGTETPPAGGESGGTETPPAGGGESGGTETPPAGGGESGGGEAPPAGGGESSGGGSETPPPAQPPADPGAEG